VIGICMIRGENGGLIPIKVIKPMHRDVESENRKIDGKMKAEELAEAHWFNYVRGVLAVHGVSDQIVTRCGIAYIAGFVRGWCLCAEVRKVGDDDHGKDVTLHRSAVEWVRWLKDGKSAVNCDEARHHFMTAFAHGWKHKEEWNGD